MNKILQYQSQALTIQIELLYQQLQFIQQLEQEIKEPSVEINKDDSPEQQLKTHEIQFEQLDEYYTQNQRFVVECNKIENSMNKYIETLQSIKSSIQISSEDIGNQINSKLDEMKEMEKKILQEEYTEEFDLSSYSDCYIMTKKYALFVEEREKRRLEKEAKKERHAAICIYLSIGEMSTL